MCFKGLSGKIIAEEAHNKNIEGGGSMFLRILSFIVTAALIVPPVYWLFNKFESKVIIPRVCVKTMRQAQIHIMRNGRGYFEHPVDVALGSERFIRTMYFLAINLFMIVVLLLFFPSGIEFWVIPAGSIKTGLIAAFVVNGLFDLVYSGNKTVSVGTLESIDEQGIAHFSGTWVKDFKANIGAYYDSNYYPEVGQKYLIMVYGDFFCSATLGPVASC